MHLYDRNGTKHRSATDGEILIGIGFLVAAILILCAVSILANHFGM